MNASTTEFDATASDGAEEPAATVTLPMPESLSQAMRTLGEARYKYVELAHQLVRDMARKGLRPGDRLGTENDLVEAHELSRTTVRQALAILEKEGFVSRKQRMGTFVKRAVYMEAEAERAAPHRTVLLVLPEREGLDPQADLASFTIFRSVVSELGDLGFAISVLALSSSPAEARQQLTRVLAARVDGICSYSCNMDPFRDLIPDLPLVTIGARYPNSGACIELDFERIAYRLVSHLIERGHRRIAMLGGPWPEYRTFMPIMAGYRRAFEEAQLPFRRELLHQAQVDETLVDLAKAVVDGQRPTAVFAEEAMVCQATLAAASALGLKVPDDLSIVSCGQMAHHITVPVRITVVLPDNAALGKQAIRRLVQSINRRELGPDHLMVEGPIVEGDSVRRIEQSLANA